MNTHPHAEIFPPMTSEEFDALADDIEANGLLEPIVLLDGKILDGRNRERACSERGVEVQYVDWDAGCGITPLEWVVSKNLHRRQLSHDQRTALAVELKDRLGEAARARMVEGGSAGGQQSHKGGPISGQAYQRDHSRRSDHIAARTFSIGHSKVTALQQVRDREPEVFARVKAGELTVESARRKVGLGPSGGTKPSKRTKTNLGDVLDPLRRYLKNWDERRLHGVTPKEARRLLKVVQEIDQTLLEVERALEQRTVVSRALS